MRIVVELDGLLRGAVLRQLHRAGHEASAHGDVRISRDGGGIRLTTEHASWTIAHAWIADDPAGPVFELASSLCDGAPILLAQDDRAPFRLAWSADIASAVIESLETKSAVDASGPTIWTAASLVESLSAALGTTPRILRVDGGLVTFRSPEGPSAFGSTRPSNETLHLRRLVDAASVVVAPERRPREIALARRLLRGVAP